MLAQWLATLRGGRSPAFGLGPDTYMHTYIIQHNATTSALGMWCTTCRRLGARRQNLDMQCPVPAPAGVRCAGTASARAWCWSRTAWPCACSSCAGSTGAWTSSCRSSTPPMQRWAPCSRGGVSSVAERTALRPPTCPQATLDDLRFSRHFPVWVDQRVQALHPHPHAGLIVVWGRPPLMAFDTMCPSILMWEVVRADHLLQDPDASPGQDVQLSTPLGQPWRGRAQLVHVAGDRMMQVFRVGLVSSRAPAPCSAAQTIAGGCEGMYVVRGSEISQAGGQDQPMLWG